LADECVGEPVATNGIRVLLDHPRRQRFLEDGKEPLRLELGDPLEGALGELASDHRGDGENPRALLVETREPPPAYLPNALGEAHLLDSHDTRRAAVAIENTLVGEVTNDLLHEERVPFRLAGDRAGERLGNLFALQRNDQGANIRLRQATQQDALDGA